MLDPRLFRQRDDVHGITITTTFLCIFSHFTLHFIISFPLQIFCICHREFANSKVFERGRWHGDACFTARMADADAYAHVMKSSRAYAHIHRYVFILHSVHLCRYSCIIRFYQKDSQRMTLLKNKLKKKKIKTIIKICTFTLCIHIHTYIQQ